ncbi:trypsin-like serine protease [Kitasatospora aburaviensis]
MSVADGSSATFKVHKSLWTAVGETADPQGRFHTLVGLTATGPASSNSALSDRPYTARLDIGGRGCTGVLVDALWVLTSGGCFADDYAQPAAVPAGAPTKKTTATIGRADLNGTGGHTAAVVELVPRADRDLVMARLDTPAIAVTPLAVSATAPSQGGELSVTGYGRTRTEWAPIAPHTASFGVGTVEATGFDLAPKAPADATVCKGDAGAPIVRTENGKPVLAGLISRSWQAGCLGSPGAETRTDAYGTRVDDLGQWIRETVLRSVAVRDANGDARSDALMAYFHADGSIAFMTSLTDTAGAFGEFTAGYQVPAGSWDRNAIRFVSGDFNGDHRADLGMMYRFADSSIGMFTGLADASGRIQAFKSSYTVPANSWDWNAIQLYAGDANGDGRSDALMAYFHADGSIAFMTSLTDTAGAFGEFTAGYQVPAGSWDRNAIRFVSGDFNGDHRADLGMMYRFADSSIGMFTGLADASGRIQAFKSSYTVPANSWDWNAIQLYAGDANGDGRSDALMAYFHADGSIAFMTSLTDTAGAFGEFTAGYQVPAGSWDRNAIRFVSGDFNGDHRADLGMMYRFADSSIGMFTGLADASGRIQAFKSSYTVPANSWDWNAIELP